MLEQPKCVAFACHMALTHGHSRDAKKSQKELPGAAAPFLDAFPPTLPVAKRAALAGQTAIEPAPASGSGLEHMSAEQHLAKHLPACNTSQDLKASRPPTAQACRAPQIKEAPTYVSALRKQDVSCQTSKSTHLGATRHTVGNLGAQTQALGGGEQPGLQHGTCLCFHPCIHAVNHAPLSLMPALCAHARLSLLINVFQALGVGLERPLSPSASSACLRACPVFTILQVWVIQIISTICAL